MTAPIYWKDDNELKRVDLTPTGLRLVEKMAREHKTIRYIASKIGLPFSKLNKMLDRNKGDNAERMAWERGHADFEQHVTDVVRGRALGDAIDLPILDENNEPIVDEVTGEYKTARVKIPGSGKDAAVLLIWFTKQLGWSEKPTGPGIVNDNRIQITLPAPMSTKEYFETLGINAPLNFKKDKSKTAPTYSLPPPE